MSNSQYDRTGSDNTVAPSRRRTIIFKNDGLVNWRIYASLGLDELRITRWIVLEHTTF